MLVISYEKSTVVFVKSINSIIYLVKVSIVKFIIWTHFVIFFLIYKEYEGKQQRHPSLTFAPKNRR